MDTFLFVKAQFSAIHCWPGCPYDEVKFLRHPHRHLFFVVLKIRTTEDRQEEFFLVKKQLQEVLDAKFANKDLGSSSCETIAYEIYCALKERFDIYSVEVSEDNENGAELRF